MFITNKQNDCNFAYRILIIQALSKNNHKLDKLYPEILGQGIGGTERRKKLETYFKRIIINDA